MELYFLDVDFQPISMPVDTAISVVWSLRYHECGTFTVVLPVIEDPELLSVASRAVYLCDRERCGRIETILCRNGLLQVEGRMLECLLYDRVAAADETFTGTAAEAVLEAMAQWAGDLPLVHIGTTPAAAAGPYTMTAGTNLGKWMHDTLAADGLSYKVEYTDGKLCFALIAGVDRSLDSETGVSRAIFSEEFGNIASLEEELFREDVCSRIYVEGSDGTVVTVDRSGSAAGRRECYKKASDIQPKDFADTDAYRAALAERGGQLLAGMGERSRLSCVAEYDTHPRYGKDYRLGDVCEIYSPAMSIRMAARLTALDVVCEGGTVRLYPCFGDAVLRLKTALTG